MTARPSLPARPVALAAAFAGLVLLCCPRPVGAATVPAQCASPLPVVAPAAVPARAVLIAAAAADPDRDGDGLPAPFDRCPEAAEDVDGFADDDGCPDPDNDGDGVPDASDACALEPETVNGIADADGCPDVGQGAVVVTPSRLEVPERIFFESGSDVLRPASAPLLHELAAVLKAHAEVRRVRIAGHTDDRGDAEANVDLSERRAQRVRAFLVEAGVAPARLEAKGYGAKRPLVPGRSEPARAQNRRVEFVVLDPAPAGGAP